MFSGVTMRCGTAVSIKPSWVGSHGEEVYDLPVVGGFLEAVHVTRMIMSECGSGPSGVEVWPHREGDDWVVRVALLSPDSVCRKHLNKVLLCYWEVCGKGG